MATTTTLEHGHPAAHGDRLRMGRIGLWLFILSESFLFTALLTSRYYIMAFYRPHELNQLLGLAITTVLLLSSLTAYRAEMCARYGDQPGAALNTLFTLLLGGGFLVGVGVEWYEAFHAFPPTTTFGTLFFTMTGIHAFHVISGLLLLLFVYFQVRRGAYGAGNYWGVEGSVKYWHFVDVAWVFIYPTLYLVA